MVLHYRAPLLPRQKSFIPPQIPNPFVHEINLKFTDKIRILLCGLFILPIRIIIFVTVLIMAWLVASFTTCCIQKVSLEPLKGWRRNVSKHFLCCLGRLLYFSMGFHVRITGKPANFSESPIFVVAPHSSFFDGIAVIASGMPSTVSREENIAVPIFGSILRSLQPILVSRTDPDSRKHTIDEITKRATSQGEWPQVLIFPEGTCTNRSCLISFKQGAFYPAVPVQPIVLRYPNTLDTVTWTWQGFTVTKLLSMTVCQFCTNVEVEPDGEGRAIIAGTSPEQSHGSARVSAFPALSSEKIKARVFDGPQIHAFVHEEEFVRKMNDKEKAAWLSFVAVLQNFLGNKKEDNYEVLVIRMLLFFCDLGAT